MASASALRTTAARTTGRLTSRAVGTTLAASLTARHLTGGAGPAKISVEHYASGWKIDDIADFTKHGKYHVQTFNKISEKVSLVSSCENS